MSVTTKVYPPLYWLEYPNPVTDIAEVENRFPTESNHWKEYGAVPPVIESIVIDPSKFHGAVVLSVVKYIFIGLGWIKVIESEVHEVPYELSITSTK